MSQENKTLSPQNNPPTIESEAGEFLARLPQTHTGQHDERIAAGKVLRKQCSRKSHAEWCPLPTVQTQSTC